MSKNNHANHSNHLENHDLDNFLKPATLIAGWTHILCAYLIQN